MTVKVTVKNTREGVELERKLKELVGLTVRIGYQRGVDFVDFDEVEKVHKERKKAKKKKGKGTSSTETLPRQGPAFPGSKRKTEKGDATKVDMCDIAMWNELGTRKAPSRPFLRMSVDENEDTIKSFVTREFKDFIHGRMTVKDLLNRLGVFQTGLVQRKIRDGKYAALSPYTIAQKGSDRPLIDTGRMRQSVHHQVMTVAEAESLDNETIK